MATAAERVYRILRKKIISNEFVPGKRLPRRKLAEMTGVSQIPVLEAMKRLEQEGLIEYRPRWGCVVSLPTPEKVVDMYALREAIECQVIRMLTLRLDPVQLEDLARRAKELDDLREGDAADDVVAELHNEFHIAMAEYTGCGSLVAPLKRVNLLWLLYRSVQSGREAVPYTKGWHMRLVGAIEAGDPEAAERAMREHILIGYEALIKSMNASISKNQDMATGCLPARRAV